MGYPIGESEVDSQAPKYFYLFGTELLARINADNPDEVHFYLDDYRGNIVAMTDKNGNITHKYEYDGYGNILNIEEADYNPFRFIGSQGVMHETHNLYYVRARYLDSENFVFLQEDPIWAENLYTYARGNPVNFTDPSGEFVPLVVIGVILLEAAIQTAADAALDEGIEALGGPEATWKTHATSFALNLVPGVGEVNSIRKGVTLTKTAIDVAKAKRASNIVEVSNKAPSSTTVKNKPRSPKNKNKNKTKKKYSVYQGLDSAGNVRYVGITKQRIPKRIQQHRYNVGTGKELLTWTTVNTGLDKTSARILEQSLINQYGLGKNGGQLLNKINSIAPDKWGSFGIK